MTTKLMIVIRFLQCFNAVFVALNLYGLQRGRFNPQSTRLNGKQLCRGFCLLSSRLEEGLLIRSIVSLHKNS